MTKAKINKGAAAVPPPASPALMKAFGIAKPVIGMIHVGALPGTPKYKGGGLRPIVSEAVKEARIYRDAGIDVLMIENMHDIPYLNGAVGPEIVSAMSVVGYEVKKAAKLSCGIQILAGANREAIAAAHAAGLDFVRAEGFVFAHVADEGIIESCAGDILRYKKSIGADNIMVFCDVKKKHSSHAITSDVDIAETAHAAEFFLADGVIVTGAATGMEASVEEVRAVKKTVKIPVLVGSGVTYDNVERYLHAADALIIGSYFKVCGNWVNTVDSDRVKKFMEKVRKIREN